MSEEPKNFDDPALKAAIAKLRGGHRAPADLRDRIARQLAAREFVTGPKLAGSGKPPTTPLVKFIAAIAAVIIVGFMGYVVYVQLYPTKPHPLPGHVVYAVNDKLLSAMVAAHAGKSPDMGCVTLSASLSDAAALALEATNKLHRPVPVVQLAGWKIDAATICTFDNAQGARFHLTKDGKSLTVVSAPTLAYGSYANGNYAKMVDGYPIAGTVQGPSLNCVVADASVDLKEVEALRDQILNGQH